MLIVNNINKLAALAHEWVFSIGNFDGFHKGHREIIDTAKKAAKKYNSKVAAITFRPHPAAILRPERAPQLINSFEMKCANIFEAGVDAIVAIDDSYELLNMSAEKFVDEFLIDGVQPVAFVEGSNFQFGYGRSGNIQTLTRLGKSRGFEVIGVELKKIAFSDGLQRVSSTLIREFIENGRVADAAKAMGREFRLVGKVIEGRGIGRTLGFPTANISPKNQIIPGEGVYAGWVMIGESEADVVCGGGYRMPSVYSIGRAKTFVGDNPLLIEAHILSKEPQVQAGIYGKWLSMDFSLKIRDQQRFANRDLLKEQISQDRQKAKEALGVCDS